MTPVGDQSDRKKWEELYASGTRPDRPPSRWVLETVGRLPNELSLVDIAGGMGRHAIPIVRTGRVVTLVDIVFQAVASARKTEPKLETIVGSASRLPLRPRQFGIVLVANYLDRGIFGDLVSLLVPGGYLVYETYTVAHLDLVRRGVARGPSSPEFLLEADELPRLAKGLVVREYLEGETQDEAGLRCSARLLASRD
jgi:SAM-dependent methyltransferase